MKINSKTLLLFFFLVVLIFVPIIKVNAINTYVGVQITATQPVNSSAYPDPATLWCLPTGTQLGVIYNSSYVSPVAGQNPITTIAPTCPGSTIWSALLPLAVSTNYTIRISTASYPFCNGYYDGVCLETWLANKNCYDVCAHYGQAVKYYNNNQCYGPGTTNCSALAALKGSPCTTCVVSPLGYSYYDTSGNCWYHNSVDAAFNIPPPDPNANGCGWKDPGFVRACSCIINYSTSSSYTFDFPWTSPASF
jgi:hypothetical protein